MPATDPLGPMVRIVDLRLAHGLTQEKLAERIRERGLDRTTAQTISNVEQGHKKASAALLTAWARALDLDPLTVWHGPTRADFLNEAV